MDGRERSFGYEPGLDGLRAIALVGVLVFHGGFSWARGGFLGVSAFFTLSGFLITTLLLSEHDTTGRVRLGAFWGRRARRLLPASFCGILLAAAYVGTAAPGEVGEAFRVDGLAALFDVANWRFVFQGDGYLSSFTQATGASTQQSPLLHYWSLAIEEQFYLLFPLAIVAVLRVARGSRAWLATTFVAGMVTSASLGLWFSRSGDTSRAYFGTDTRALELLVGALLALTFTGARAKRIKASRSAGWLGIGALGVCLFAWSSVSHDDPALFRGALFTHALLVAVVIVAAMSAGPLRWLLSAQPLVVLGRVSYGAYVFHWSLFQWIDADRTGLDGASLFAVQVCATLAITAVAYRLFEQPIRQGRARRTVRWSAGPAWLAVGSAVLLAASSTPAVTTVFEPVASHRGPLTAVDRRIQALDSDLPAMPAAPGRGPSSFAGSLESAASRRVERVLIVGDSVALTLGRGIERWGMERDVAVWNLGRKTCGIPRAPIQVAWREIDSTACAEWPRIWAAAVEGFDPDVVIVLSPVWDAMPHRAAGWASFRTVGDRVYDRWLTDEYRAAADVLSARGARVVWLDVPCTEGRALTPAGRALNAVVHRLDTLSHDVEVVSLRDRLCGARGPWAHSRQSDGFHFSDPGADLVGGWVMTRLVPEGDR